MTAWIKLFNKTINLEVLTKVAPTKGNLVYEYNPFRNYRINQNMYEYLDLLYSLEELYKNFGICIKIGIAIKDNKNNYIIYKDVPEKKANGWYINGEKIKSIREWVVESEYIDKDTIIKILQNESDPNISSTKDQDEFGSWILEAYQPGKNIDRKNLEQALIKAKLTDWYGVPTNTTDPVLRESGELCDFISDELNLSINHPVHIIPQASYDGSVNLIINDGINIPRLINSRFSATGKNTYEVIDRKGNNDTNIYDLGDQFDIDTSLYKKIIKIPKIKFKGTPAGGNLKVGNYFFYFKLSDADGNETDFVGESGLVSVFIGTNNYYSVTSGQKDQNSFKLVNFQISNIDSAYDYVTVYYSRSSAEGLNSPITQYVKIDKKYSINNASIANIVITGFENTIDISASDINLNYNVVESAYTSAQCLNMLFLGNIRKPNIPYKELSDLSLRFLPYLKEEDYGVSIDLTYITSTTNKGYIDPKFIYEKTGYWGGEIYRFGIVYILKNGELSPVFNVRGNFNIGPYNEDEEQYTNIPVRENNDRKYINYHEEKYTLLEDNAKLLENVKGVVSFKPTRDTDTIYSVDFRVDDDTIQELKNYIKGYFFVRQTRIPLILALGITIGIDKESHVPTIPTAAGFLDELSESLDKTHVVTEDINDVNYISESFISRYLFKFVSTGGIWGLIGKIVAVVAVAVASVFTFGALAPAAGILAGTMLVPTLAGTVATVTVGSMVAATSVVLGAVAIAGAVVTGAIYSAVSAIGTAANRNKAKKSLNGKATKTPAFHKKVETDESRLLTLEYLDRIIIKDPSKNLVAGIICPDYSLNQPYYNQIFTGNEHLILLTSSLNINKLNGYSSNYFTNDERHFYVPAYYDLNIKNEHTFKITGVPDSIKAIGVENTIFRSKGGEAEEAWLYACISEDYKDEPEDMEKNTTLELINSDIVRGNFGSYLAFNDTNNTFDPAEIVNIYIPEYSSSKINDYFYIRMIDNSIFYAITDRFDIKDIDELLVVPYSGISGTIDRSKGYHINAYRGDCYLCQYTHRIIRNFNDPSAPYNDEIVDEKSWKENYKPQDQAKYQKINLGDVNAVQLGMWVTFKLRSSNNLNIRTLDETFINEELMTGHPRGYYPYHPMSVEGNYKHSDSQSYNKGFSKSVGDRWNFEQPDVPHIKNWFGTRIIYSDIHINDAFKNGFRTFKGTNYRDYTREYGEITKLISIGSNLLCVFEHGIALIPVNERAVAGLGSGGNIYINTSNVLPENPKIISDSYGSQWPESIIKVPGKYTQYVYGVDTVAKKIWRTNGSNIECISDFKVLEFLNNNISLGERELTPIIGIRNVKTYYNAFKQDVLFTFYDNTYGFEEKVWNLCWNELLQLFVTFYSWVPSCMENINNIPFSFDRNTSKWIAKLGTSHSENSFADGITLSNIIIDDKPQDTLIYKYINNQGKEISKSYVINDSDKFIGTLSLNNRILPDSLYYYIKFTLERDNYGNNELFEIKPLKIEGGESLGELSGISLPDDAKFPKQFIPLWGLYYKTDIKNLYSELYYRNSEGNLHADYDEHKQNYIVYEEGIPVELDEEALEKPIYKDISGKRLMLPREKQLNPDKIVRLLNIKAHISLFDINDESLSDKYYDMLASYQGSLIDMGLYESTVAVMPKWNMQFLSTDFWKHGLAGIIDITDDIKPTYWYGKQHPFEFEFIVANDPAVHKIFTNLEIISNNAKPESFHYEIIGDSYDFAKDKINMYFRLEAIKALWQYNGADITYNRDFLKIQPKQQNKSADIIRIYYAKLDTINDIEDYYLHIGNLNNYDYKHLSGGEIKYYPNRGEYRIWNHVKAVCADDLPQDNPSSVIRANCRYLEDKWLVTINPLLICYKNEYINKGSGSLFLPENSTWKENNSGIKLPNLPILNSPIPLLSYDYIKNNNGDVDIPEILSDLGYNKDNFDLKSWVSGNENIYGIANNRKETDIRDKFIKIRIRYSGEDLAIIDYLNTIYQISYA